MTPYHPVTHLRRYHMHQSVMEFGKHHLTTKVVMGQRILEVGSRNVNGSLRQHCMLHRPAMYIGTDMEPGEGVDVVIRAEALTSLFINNAFDLIICTEMLEHCANWRTAIWEMTRVLTIDGYLLLTTRSPGFPRHEHPLDYWRFSLEGLAEHLSWQGYDVDASDDPEAPGVLIWAQKISRSVDTWAEPRYEPDQAPL